MIPTTNLPVVFLDSRSRWQGIDVLDVQLKRLFCDQVQNFCCARAYTSGVSNVMSQARASQE
jgi:hypothetical protein